MPSCHVRVTATSPASPSAVFALLADIRTWCEWGAWVSTELEAPAPDGSGGVGAIRCLTSRAFGRTIVSRERVEEVVPDRRLVYSLLSGLPLVGYQGVIELEPDGAGTKITWSSSFDPEIFGTGWLYKAILQRFITDTAHAVAKAA
jgi:hypothetical protein